MTQYERMEAGLIYDPADEEIFREQLGYQEKLWELNHLKPSEYAKKRECMKELFAECGDGCYLELPFYANWGGHHVHFGKGVYANFNLTIVDDGPVYVGDHVLIGPNVTLATASHPIEPGLREKGLQYNKEVRIGSNTWIGAGVTVVPGVHIGSNAVIGAGSVVTRDIPDNVVAAGNPCRVLREVGPRDREYFYREEKIDWENLGEKTQWEMGI